ncbi:MAG: hypothetical protein EXR93_06155 [Gemmatimonadetes bacterium]|nr:hypothetical protein [Gemmatimonadota bacterium]
METRSGSDATRATMRVGAMLAAAALAAACAPEPETIGTGGETLTDGRYDVVIRQTPPGQIPIGTDASITVTVFHMAVGTTPAVWSGALFAGELVTALGPLTPTALIDLPASAPLHRGGRWTSTNLFRCTSGGPAQLNYRVELRHPLQVDGAGSRVDSLKATAQVDCGDLAPNAPPPVPLTDPNHTRWSRTFGEMGYGGFVIRMWRAPAGDPVKLGDTVYVHVEVENNFAFASERRPDTTYRNWGLQGEILTQGSALVPRRINDTPKYLVQLGPGDTWRGDFKFVCQRPGVADIWPHANILREDPANGWGNDRTLIAYGGPFRCGED